MSFAAEVIADSTGQWSGNLLRFATEEEAKHYVADLMQRWTLVTDTRVVPSDADINARIVNNELQHWNSDTWCNRCHRPLHREGNGTCECGGLIEERGWK